MKPKYRNYRRILPTVISIAMSLPFAAQAATLSDPSGNVTPVADGADTVLASGGTDTTPTVTINAGIDLTGSTVPVTTSIIAITAANYTVTTASTSTLIGTNHDGINSTFAFTLTNSGTIRGVGTARQGVDSVGGTTSITNNLGAIISGVDDAIRFTTDGGIVTNSGTIQGLTGGLSDGIQALNDLVVTNNAGATISSAADAGIDAGDDLTVTNSGSITAFDEGITADDDLELTNNQGATISGTTDEGVLADDDAEISNSGTISGTNGISVGDRATINNFTTLTPLVGGTITGTAGSAVFAGAELTLTNIATGIINGATNGINTGNDAEIENAGSITGATNGIDADDDADITNFLGGTITGNGGSGLVLLNDAEVDNRGAILGSTNGISAQDDADIVNESTGTITGTTGAGVILEQDAVVENSGLITGATFGINVDDDGEITNNSGATISATGAAGVGLFAEDDVLVLNSGTITGLLDGLRADDDADITNNSGASITGTNGKGIFVDENGVIVNDGSITGGDDGVFVNGVNGSVTNSGSIAGITGANSDGIQGASNFLSVTNETGGTITGLSMGINALANLTLVNEFNAAVTGNTSNGVFATTTADIDNNGTILGNTNGIVVTSGANITNFTNFNISSVPTSGGSITGTTGNGISATTGLTVLNEYLGSITGSTIGIDATSGATINNFHTITGAIGINVTSGAIINNKTTVIPGPTTDVGGTITGNGGNGVTATDDLTLVNEAFGTIIGSTNGIVANNGGTPLLNIDNRAIITGQNGDGVRAQDNFDLTNSLTGVITGTNGTGVWLDDAATVTNDGSIIGTNSGVRVSENSTVTNTGTIRGSIGIDAFGSGGFFNLTNSGTIEGTGGTAIDGILGNGVDTYNFNSGSLVTGDIFLRSGVDVITMTKGAASSIVNGDIDGGTGIDTLNFVNGQTVASGTPITNRVTGNVSNFEDINKTGTGTAFIIGNTNSDTIDVTGGALYIVGNVDGTVNPQSTITVTGATAEIGGTGTWDANIGLTNGATISPGQINLPIASTVANSIGTMTVTGNVTLDASSRYVVNMGSNDLIVLTDAGVFTTAGGAGSQLLISPTNVNTPLIDGSRIVVDTETTLVGNFTVSLAPFPSTTPDTGFFEADGSSNPIIIEYFTTLAKVNGFTANSDWQLTIVHDYGQFGATPNEVAAGDMLDGLVGTATGDLADLFAAMDYSDESTTAIVLNALDPGSYMAAAAGIANNNFQLHRTVEGHNAAVRAGQPDCDGAANVWGGFSYSWQDLNVATTSLSPFDQDGETTSFYAGIDFSVAENLRLGVVAQGSTTDWTGSANATDVDSYRFAAYANWGAATGWFADALIGYNTNEVDQNRNFDSGNYDADGWQGLINVGYAIETSAGAFSPFVGFEWQSMSVDGTESALGPIPIDIDGYDIDSFRALAGVRWEGQLGSTVKGYASVAYAFEFEDDAPTTTVGFGGGSYTAEGMEQGDALLISAGLRWSVTDCTTIDIGYNGEFASDDGVDSNSANVGVNYSF